MILISMKSFYYLLHFGFFIFLPLYCTCMYTCNHKVLATLLSSQCLPMVEKISHQQLTLVLWQLCVEFRCLWHLIPTCTYMYVQIQLASVLPGALIIWRSIGLCTTVHVYEGLSFGTYPMWMTVYIGTTVGTPVCDWVRNTIRPCAADTFHKWYKGIVWNFVIINIRWCWRPGITQIPVTRQD